MTKQTPKTLEQRIANALTDPHIATADLYEPISETEVALTAAETTAEAERRKAVDAVTPDAAEAERSAWAAEVHRDRLHSLLSRLRQRLADVSAAEHSAQREADYEAVKTKRDALAREFVEFYPDLCAGLSISLTAPPLSIMNVPVSIARHWRVSTGACLAWSSQRANWKASAATNRRSSRR